MGPKVDSSVTCVCMCESNIVGVILFMLRMCSNASCDIVVLLRGRPLHGQGSDFDDALAHRYKDDDCRPPINLIECI